MANADTVIEKDTSVAVAMRPPSKFNVVLYNDDATTMEFVVLVLMTIFHKSFEDASALTLHIHANGKGVAGVYSFEIAVQKREEVLVAARANNFPLKCEIQEA
jgi:ATP-dependent Clp protease adaptor protein ClpS